jgi:uncharacterized protein YndB with AHSA1/START domain
MPRYTAERTLAAPIGDVWAFLAEPYHLSDWWPNLGGVEPDRRGLVPGARWKIRAADVLSGAPVMPFFGPGMFKRPGAAGTLLVTDVIPGRRLAFQLVSERIEAEVSLEALDDERTRIGLAVDAPWAAIRRSFPTQALARLYDLVQTGAES